VRLRERPWVALLPLGLAAGVIAIALVATSAHEEDILVNAILSLFLGWSFIGSGLFAWARRPPRR